MPHLSYTNCDIMEVSLPSTIMIFTITLRDRAILLTINTYNDYNIYHSLIP